MRHARIALITLISLLAAVLLLAADAGSPARAAEPLDGVTDQCRLCHTTPALLVPAVREADRAAQAVKRDLPGASVETTGEG